MLETSSFTVRVVDDEKIIALTQAPILKYSGFSAVAFTNPLGAQAFDKEITSEKYSGFSECRGR